GNYVIVGAYYEDEDTSGANTMARAGSAYIFERDGTGNWSQVQKITASDRAGDDQFGLSVSISDYYAIVGAFREDHDTSGINFLSASGAAYIFESCATTSAQSITACDSYTWNSIIYTSSGNYMQTILNASGCDSVMTLNLTINTVDTSVTVNDTTLTSNASMATYQWLDCDNGNAPISGETNQSFTATANGNYAVKVTQNGCIDTSACYNITNVGFLENDFSSELTVYPNPTEGSLTINFGKKYTNLNVKVRSIAGQHVSTFNFGTTNKVIFELEGVIGFYFIDITTKEGKTATLKVLKN
ncbi:T9SS type A sorting domain-containing protein, partial [Candidatus Amoebophilus asiaticus]|nr:T9SS type A sorting domain-containing protein [Candidatus Amoebophilus asiaticus]